MKGSLQAGLGTGTGSIKQGSAVGIGEGGRGWLRGDKEARCHCQPHHALSSPATGSLNLLVRSRNKGALDTHAWSLSGNKGNVWQQAHVPINPSGPFQVSRLAKVPCRFLGGLRQGMGTSR